MDIDNEIKKVLEYNKSKNVVLEMSIPRKSYKNHINNLVPQLLENWCLVRHCTLSNNTRYKKHWQDELIGHFITISRLSIKGNDSVVTRKKVLEEIWSDNDFNVPLFLNLTIANKFLKENLNIKDETYGKVLSDCIKEQNNIFNVILSRDVDVIVSYVKSI